MTNRTKIDRSGFLSANNTPEQDAIAEKMIRHLSRVERGEWYGNEAEFLAVFTEHIEECRETGGLAPTDSGCLSRMLSQKRGLSEEGIKTIHEMLETVKNTFEPPVKPRQRVKKPAKDLS